MKKGQKTTTETRARMSAAHKGKPNGRLGTKLSEETKSKIAKKLKLNSWMIGNFGKLNPFYGKKHDEETKQKMSERVKESYANGRIHTFQGKKRPEISGEKSYAWKGGITPVNVSIRHSLEYKLWRDAVFTRDNFTCVWCGQVSKIIHADHIQTFAEYPELRFAIDNGRTLCKSCHLKRHSKDRDN